MKIITLITLTFLSLNSHAVVETELNEKFHSEVLPFIFHHTKQKRFLSKDSKLKHKASIFYLSYKVQNPKGVIVLSPGRTQSYANFYELFYDLRNEGYDIFAIDHIGQGHSQRLLTDVQKCHVKKFSQYLVHFERFMNKVIKVENYEKRILIGHSMGGHIATHYAKTNPDRVHNLFLSAPMYDFPTGKYTKFQATQLSRILVLLGQGNKYAPGKGPYDLNWQFEGNDSTNSKTRFEIQKYIRREYPMTQLGGPTARWVMTSIYANKALEKDIDRIYAKTTIFQAELDAVVLNPPQNQLCEKMRNCNLILMKGAKHSLLHGKDKTRNFIINKIKEVL